MSSVKLLQDDLPPVPSFVLRGHASPVQALCYTDQDLLFSGDGLGFVILWSLETCRAVAIWRAHTDAILSLASIGHRLLTHGRDNKLRVWERLEDGPLSLSTTLPFTTAELNPLKQGEADSCHRPKPFLQASLDVNALHFCKMALAPAVARGPALATPVQDSVLVAVPGLVGSEYIDVYEMPSTHRLITRIQPTSPEASVEANHTTAPPPLPATQGLHKGTGTVMSLAMRYPYLAAGYESGLVAVFVLDVSCVDPNVQRQDGRWREVVRLKQHRDAVLSVTLRLDKSGLYVYSSGVDAIIGHAHLSSALLETALAKLKEAKQEPARQHSSRIVELMDTAGSDTFSGLQVLAQNTKHAGQQSITIRNDGKLLATAGWDGRGRVYARSQEATTLKSARQVAVLKWHREGAVQVVAMADVEPGKAGQVALGGKDGKISLWDLY